MKYIEKCQFKKSFDESPRDFFYLSGCVEFVPGLIGKFGFKSKPYKYCPYCGKEIEEITND